MVHVALALLMALTGATSEVSESYEAACARAEKEKKPLLVLVGRALVCVLPSDEEGND